MTASWLRSLAGTGLLAGAVSAAAAGDVSVNGIDIPRAVSTVESTQEVTEFRAIGQPIQLVPGAKRYAVCVVAASPVAVLDAELPLPDTPSRFVVKVEDGREFANCLLASLKAEGAGGKRRLAYCLRCEDVTL